MQKVGLKNLKIFRNFRDLPCLVVGPVFKIAFDAEVNIGYKGLSLSPTKINFIFAECCNTFN
ncbi:MAG: hypothetical protein QXH80_02375, partial [Candidatus Nanoarchaeia archaeon]